MTDLPRAPFPVDDLIRSAPLDLHRGVVPEEWIDLNGHMNVGYYIVAFDRATGDLCNQIGLNREYTEQKIGMCFVLEDHATYNREIMAGDAFGIETQILDHDHKRLHFFHTMYLPHDRSLVATNEVMMMNIAYDTRRSAPWPDWAAARIATLAELHSRLPRPRQVGRVIAIPRRS